MNLKHLIAARSRRGIVLVIVMLVIVMISLAGLSYVWTLSTENKAVRLRGDELQLDEILASGREYVQSYCADTWQQRQQRGGLSENESLFRNIAVDCDAEGSWQARFSVLAPQTGETARGGYRYGLQDESTKLNLAVLQQWDEAEPGSAEQALSGLPGMTEAIAAAILDWIDPDTASRSSGAEAEYYTGQRLPYVPRDGVPAALEELLLVRDVGRYQLFGADTNRNYQIDAAESQAQTASPAGRAATDQPPWAEMLTVHSAERNVTCDGTERIHVNQEDIQQLYDELSELFEDSWVTFIIAYRQYGPGEAGATSSLPPESTASPGRPARRSGRGRSRRDDPEAFSEPDLSVPARFPIESIYDLIGARVSLPAENELEDGRSSRRRRRPSRITSRESVADLESPDEPLDAEQRILTSPFEAEPSRMTQYLPQLLDRLKLDDTEVIPGRINIRRAPRAVIAAIPGIEPDIVDRILATRETADATDVAAVRHLVWLLGDEVVDLEQMRALSPYVTGGGDVFRGQIVAMLDGSSRVARAEVVVDATASPPRQLYWKDLSMLGRGFTADVVGGVEAAGPGMTN